MCKRKPRIAVLSGIFEQPYREIRGDEIGLPFSAPKRRDLYRALQTATGMEIIVLSFPPKGGSRSLGKWLRAVETVFFTNRQLFCCGWDIPKLRVLHACFFYPVHVMRHVRNGDIVVMDNYEITGVIAAWIVRLLRRVNFILDYEDGYHRVDHTWPLPLRVLNRIAEIAGRPLIQAAILAHPALRKRLPASVPTALVPGLMVSCGSEFRKFASGSVHFLCSGFLDTPRGVDMVLESLEFLPEEGWHLDISGGGPLEDLAAQTARNPRWAGRVTFHGALHKDSYQQLIAECHVGLNCQRSSDLISSVTFPSKIFSYISSGLTVLSSRASEVPAICGEGCLYFDEETPKGLAAAMSEIINDPERMLARSTESTALTYYSMSNTESRLKKLVELAIQH